jgi:hypothetical protein
MKSSPAYFIACLLAAALATAATPQEKQGVEHDIYGTVLSIDGSSLKIETRSKKVIQVDIKPAIEAHSSNVAVVGRSMEIRGGYDRKGVLHATSVQRAKDSAALWPEDK